MKMTKKKVFVVALALSLVAIVSMGTLAWFTDFDEVDNEFLIAGSENGDPDDIFSVEVWEDKDGDGQPDDDITGDDEGLVYEDILPGDKLAKKVFVKNTGSYEQYIRVIVVVSNAAEWRSVLGVASDVIPELSAIVGGLDTAKWNPAYKMYDAANNNFWYSLYYNGTLPAETNNEICVFESVKVPESMTREQAAEFKGGFEIAVVAQAVQTDNVGGNAPAAFTTVNLSAHDAYEEIISNNP